MESDIPRVPLPGERPWIPAPTALPLLWPRERQRPGPATWKRYTLKGRQPCTTCIQVLQDHQRRPFDRQPGNPHPSTWIREDKETGTRTFHCSQHGADMKLEDDREMEKRRRVAHEWLANGRR